MYIKVLLNYIFGFITIRIEGFFVEKYINICISKNIFLWNIKRTKSTIAYMNIGIRNFRKAIKIAKDNKCRIKIINKKGIPFLLNKYRKRKIFAIVLLIVILGIISLSNFIWNIDITGVEKIDKEELVKQLEDCNLKIGCLKSKINTKEIIDRIRLERNDLAWIGIEIKGTNATVKVVEATPKPDIINEKDYCNIVATKPGKIVKINAQNGTPVVHEDDEVAKGDILVAGWLDGKYVDRRYVHANGQVQAKVYYLKKEKMELKQLKTEKTGASEHKYSVRINNFQINFYKTLSKFKKYDTIEKVKTIKLFSNFYLPIEITEKINSELNEIQVLYSKEDVKNILREKVSNELEEQIKDKDSIINRFISYNETEDSVEIEVKYEVLEEIGTKEKIVF